MDAFRVDFRIAFLLVVMAAMACKHVANGRSQKDFVSCRNWSMVRYKLTLQTLWSKKAFPKQFPLYRPKPQWSALVGRTHDDAYIMWQVGINATAGVKMFAEEGDPRYLDIEGNQGYNGVFDSFSSPPIVKSFGQTSSIIALDGRHSKLSFMVRMVPSPDWFIGLDSLDLCSQGEWKKKVHVNLRPYDAGTDQGLTFTSPNWPNEPMEPVSEITAHKPDHPASSFYYPQYDVLPRIAFVDLELISQYRHKTTFMEVPRYSKAKTGLDDLITIPGRVNENINSTADVDLEETSQDSVSNLALETSTETDVSEDILGVTDVSGSTDEPLSLESTGSQGLFTNRNLEISENTGDPETDDYAFYGVSAGTRPSSTGSAGSSQSSSWMPESTTYSDTRAAGIPVMPKYKMRQVSAYLTKSRLLPKILEADADGDEGFGSVKDKTKHEPGLPMSELIHDEPRLAEAAPKLFDTTTEAAVHCEIGEWGAWSPCSETCGFGKQVRERPILQMPKHGGSNCPRLRQENLCGSMRKCRWNHFSFLGDEPSKPSTKPSRRVRTRRVRYRRRY